MKNYLDIGSRYLVGVTIGACWYFPCAAISQQFPHNGKGIPELSLLDSGVKIHCFSIGVLAAPITEELIYRGLIQGTLLSKIFQSKVARILPVAFLFAARHDNTESAFFLGLELGIIKESRLKIHGSIGAHMANNFLSLKNSGVL